MFREELSVRENQLAGRPVKSRRGYWFSAKRLVLEVALPPANPEVFVLVEKQKASHRCSY